MLLRCTEEHEQIYPQLDGWTQHEKKSGTREVIWKASQGRLQPRDPGSHWITNQRETTVVWNRKTHGKPVSNALVAGYGLRTTSTPSEASGQDHFRSRLACR